MSIHIPYDPESVCGDFGWLWLGRDWHLIRTVEADSGALLTLFIADDEDADVATHYSAVPYLPCSAPTAEPGQTDAIEVTLRLRDGDSITYSTRSPAAAQALERAVMDAIAAGHPE